MCPAHGLSSLMSTIELLGIIGVALIALTISSAAWSYTTRYVRRERQQGDLCRSVMERWAREQNLRFDEQSMKVEGASAAAAAPAASAAEGAAPTTPAPESAPAEGAAPQN